MRLVTRDCGFYGGGRDLLEDGVGKGDTFADAGIAFGVQRIPRQHCGENDVGSARSGRQVR